MKYALALALALSTSLPVQAQDKFISIATGGTAGIYFPLGGALAKLWTDRISGVQATAEVTGASVENTRLVVADEAQVALGTGNVVYEAYAGVGRFEKRGRQPILAISAVYPNAIQIVTLEGSGIRSLPDLVGKRVSIGAPGSGTEAMNRDVFNAVGITYDQFAKAARLSYAETTNAMKDGNLDAGSLSVGLGSVYERGRADPGNRQVPVLFGLHHTQGQLSGGGLRLPHHSGRQSPVRAGRCRGGPGLPDDQADVRERRQAGPDQRGRRHHRTRLCPGVDRDPPPPGRDQVFRRGRSGGAGAPEAVIAASPRGVRIVRRREAPVPG